MQSSLEINRTLIRATIGRMTAQIEAGLLEKLDSKQLGRLASSLLILFQEATLTTALKQSAQSSQSAGLTKPSAAGE